MSQIVEHPRSLFAALIGALLMVIVGQCSAATLTVTSTGDSGIGSLREAINQANMDNGDTIQFNLAGSGPFTIALASQLPTITRKMSIVGGKSLERSILISGNGSSRIMQIGPRGAITLQYLTFEDARSDGAGGAIFNSGNLTIQNSTFANNTAASDNFFADAVGGAIYTELSSKLTVTNSTFSHNTALHSSAGRAFGGAIFGDDDSKLAITNCTFLDNSADGAIAAGGGAIVLSLASTLNLKGDILAGSDPANCGIDSSGILRDRGFNIADDDSCKFSTRTSRVITPTSAIGLESGLAYNGGPTQTVALKQRSPAIDVIPNSLCTDQSTPPKQLTIDQRGFPRPTPANNPNDSCDIGAYESQSVTALDCGGAAASTPNLSAVPSVFYPETIDGVSDPLGSFTISITGVTQDKPVPSFPLCPNAFTRGATTFVRTTSEPGFRPNDSLTYQIQFTATDNGTGETCAGAVPVCVQTLSNRSKGCGDHPPSYDATRCPR